MKLRRPAAEALRILVPEVGAREMGAGSRTGLAVGVNCNELAVGVNGDELEGVEVGTDIPWGVEVGTHILWGVVAVAVIYRLVEVVVKEMVAASDGSAVAARVRVEGVNIQHMEAEVVVEALYKVVATAVEENGQVVVVMVTEEVGKDEDRMAEEVNVEVVVVSGAEVVVNGVEEAAVEANYSSKEWVRAAAGVSILELAAEASLAVEEVVVWDSKLAEGVMVKEAEATAEVEASKRVAEVTAAVEKAAGEMAGEEAGESKQVEEVVVAAAVVEAAGEVSKLVAGAVEVGEVSEPAAAVAEARKLVGAVAEVSGLVAAAEEENAQGVVGAGALR